MEVVVPASRQRRSRNLNIIESSETGSESDPIVDLIKIDDIFKYYDVEPGVGDDVDPEIVAAQRQRKREMCQRTIDRINRNLPMIRENWAKASPLEIYIAFNMSFGDPEEMVFQIRDPSFLAQVKNESKERQNMLNPAKRAAHLQELNKARQAELDESESDSEPTYSRRVPGVQQFIKHHKKHTRRTGPTCYVSCPEEVEQEVWDTWSDIHRTSYLLGMKSPNTYLYRNCPPGEKQKNGPWSEAEKELFLERLAEMKAMGLGTTQWGIFSEKIPGRVGYQCSNFYRKLVQAGEIQSDEYVQDESGKWHFVGQKSASKPKEPKAPKAKAPAQLSWYEKKALKNPFPNEIDFITKNEIKVPAMSPDGYVLDYQTWLSILKERASDPFTGKHINKRQLVILTKKNVDEYRDQIKNIGRESDDM